MPFFDSLFWAADDVLDSVFAGSATYRAAGTAIALTDASVRSLSIGQDLDRDAAASWLGYVVELHLRDLVVNGLQWEPSGGDEIAFPIWADVNGTWQATGGNNVYKVVANKDGRTFEPLDTHGRKVLVFVKLIRTEPPGA
jgi:hypothetical protein